MRERHGDRARKAASEAIHAKQEVKTLVHDVQFQSRDMASWGAAMKHTAIVFKAQREAINDTITKLKMAMGNIEAQAERSRTNADMVIVWHSLGCGWVRVPFVKYKRPDLPSLGAGRPLGERFIPHFRVYLPKASMAPRSPGLSRLQFGFV